MGKSVRIFDALSAMHQEPICELEFSTPFELLIAVILSAQCTDKRVNMITPSLFEKYNTAEDFAVLEVGQLIPFIKSCGFYNSKAKNIIGAAKSIVQNFEGRVPKTVEELVTLDGVGRKTANVVYSVAFGGNAIAVDTHVFRVSRRLGIASSSTPDKVEQELQKFFPESKWSIAHHLMIHHGRYICKARGPMCNECKLTKDCKYFLRGKNE